MKELDLLITASVNIYQTKKKYSNSNENFSERKMMKQFGTSPFSKRTPLSTNPLISEQFFHDPPFCPNFKNKKPPNFTGEETMVIYDIFSIVSEICASLLTRDKCVGCYRVTIVTMCV